MAWSHRPALGSVPNRVTLYPCSTECDETGALFRIVAVERYSSRLLEHLASLYADGVFATAEAFASSACALAAAKGEWACRVGDWASTPRMGHAPQDSSMLGRSTHNDHTAELVPGQGSAGATDANLNHTSWRTVPGVLPARNYRGEHYYFYPARFGYIESFCVSH